MTNNNDKVIKDLERKLGQLEVQVKELNHRINYLERENNRRKSEMNQMSSALARRT